MTADEQRRFLAKLMVGDGCWLWFAARTPAGYGVMRVGGVPSYAHRLAYEWFVGPIPKGLHIDHLCRVRNCVRPDHLEAVTAAENRARGLLGDLGSPITHCKWGHPFSEDNTRIGGDGYRYCRACGTRRSAERRQREAARR